MKLTQRLRIRGVVQGVGYREGLRRVAASTGVAGWVRNRRDGTVEAVVHGPADAVAAVVEWARRGPPLASVHQVEVHEADGDYSEFVVHPTE